LLLGQRGQGSHIGRDGQLIMLSTSASLHHGVAYLQKLRLVQPSSSGAPV
jgi:hypothetical protein